MDLSTFSAAGFDRGASRLKEAAWIVAKVLLFQTAWPWPSRLRVAVLRGFGARIGAHAVIRARVNITFPWRLVLGDHVWIGEEVFILSLAPVTIESSVCVSQRSFLCTGSHDHRSNSFDLQTRPIILREGSWVGAQAFIGPGVEVGPGTVVAAGAIVMESVGPKKLVRGNPAVVVSDL